MCAAVTDVVGDCSSNRSSDSGSVSTRKDGERHQPELGAVRYLGVVWNLSRTESADGRPDGCHSAGGGILGNCSRVLSRQQRVSVNFLRFTDRLTLERLTRDREVTGSSLTHCTVENGPVQATRLRVPPSPSSIIWC